eukprot:SAG22_NODE_5070_length_1092_cov_1.257805_1_plen_261_part_10
MDNDGGGEIDYNEFAEDMKQNDQAATMVEERVRVRGPAAGAQEAMGIGKDNVKDILSFIQQKIEGKSGSLTKVFRSFDDDRSGSVDYNEFRKGLLSLGVPLNDGEFDILIAEVDNDGGGEIEYNEFAEDMKQNGAQVHAMVAPGSQNALMEQELKKAPAVPKGLDGALGRRNRGISMPDSILQYVRDKIEAKSLNIHEMYRHFDENHDMYVTPVEFKEGLAGLGIQLQGDQFEFLVRHVDVNSNGTIDYNEFVSDVKNIDV